MNMPRYLVLILALMVMLVVPTAAEDEVWVHCQMDNQLQERSLDIKFELIDGEPIVVSEYAVIQQADGSKQWKEKLTVKKAGKNEFMALFITEESPKDTMYLSISFDVVGETETKLPKYLAHMWPMMALNEIVEGRCWLD